MNTKKETALAAGRYTAERLQRDKPEIYKSIIRMLGAGMSISQIQRFLAVHHRTVAAVAAREMPSVDDFRKQLTARIAIALQSVTDELVDRINEGKLKSGELSHALGVLFDRYQLLTGGATVRIEKIETEDIHAKLEEFLSKLPEADVKVIEKTGQNTGSAEEKSGLLPVAETPQTLAE